MTQSNEKTNQKTNEKKFFGTDGIRGEVGKPPITPDWVLKLGWAAGKVLGSRSHSANHDVLIGKDTRVSGYMFEAALEAGLVAAGMNVELLGPMPTPGIAYLTRTFRAVAGIVISASHNLHIDNGIKFFSSKGQKLNDEVELLIEKTLEEPLTVAPSELIGKASRVPDAAGRYIEFCKSTFPKELSLRGLKIVLDCAHGATYQIAPNVFRELGAKTIVIGAEPNGFNINHEVGSTHPASLQAKVLEEKADLGIAFDGDGDRVLMVDHAGAIVDGDDLLFIIAAARKKSGQIFGGVVGTLMTNFGFEIALEKEKIPFERTQVGDRYVMQKMIERNWLLGGEASGHIICLDRTSTGDGIISALQVLEALILSEKTLHQHAALIEKIPQQLIGVRVKHNPKAIAAHPKLVEKVAAIEKQLFSKGRIVVRASGTEPVVRLMIEYSDSQQVDLWIEDLQACVKACEQELEKS
ncbi:MAG: phosphoglucosamine mutase [Pseudomonadota bacterium]